MIQPQFSEEAKDDRAAQDELWESYQYPDWGPDEISPSNNEDD